jgi:hypothetical protein
LTSSINKEDEVEEDIGSSIAQNIIVGEVPQAQGGRNEGI